MNLKKVRRFIARGQHMLDDLMPGEIVVKGQTYAVSLISKTDPLELNIGGEQGERELVFRICSDRARASGLLDRSTRKLTFQGRPYKVIDPPVQHIWDGFVKINAISQSAR